VTHRASVTVESRPPYVRLSCVMSPAVTVVVKTVPVIVGGGSYSATTIIAVVGVVLALASLAWQAVSFRLSGSRVSVDLRPGMRHGTGTAAVTSPAPVFPGQMEMMQSQGFTDPVLAVEVRNAGRSATNIVNVAVLFSNGASYSDMVFNPPLPFRLEGESEQTWYFERGPVEAYAKAMGQVFKAGQVLTLRGMASIGGKTKPVVSKTSVGL
jgi:hypothetical protein